MFAASERRGATQVANENPGGRRSLTWRKDHSFYNIAVTVYWLSRFVWRNGPLVCLGSAFCLLWLWLLIQFGNPLGALYVALIPVALSVSALCAWGHFWPAAFEQWVGRHIRARWRYLTVYAPRWRGMMQGAGLAKLADGVESYPDLKRLISTRFIDRAWVKPRHAAPLKPWEDAAEGMAITLKAERIRVRAEHTSGRIVLDVYRKDALRAIVKPLVPEAKPNLAALPIGLTEFGSPLLLPLCGSSFAHALVLGVTGSGKGSLYHSAFRAMGPGIKDGSIRLCGIDTKGGMEYRTCEPLFYRLATNLEDALRLAQWFAAKLTERAERYGRDGVRLHVASPQTPSYVLAIDELSHPLAYAPREIATEFDKALRLILSQGRAPGFSVLAAAQDPRVETLKSRDMFSTTIALRFNTEAQAVMALGKEAVDGGAECHKIRSEPEGIEAGIGYAIRQGGVVRFRSCWYDNDEIKKTYTLYPKPQLLAVAA